jgi:hypothetical protein
MVGIGRLDSRSGEIDRIIYHPPDRLSIGWVLFWWLAEDYFARSTINLSPF